MRRSSGRGVGARHQSGRVRGRRTDQFRGNVRGHRNAMLGLYLGGIMIAGTLAFMPGRIMHAVVFGP